MFTDLIEVVVLEGAVVTLVETNQDRHLLTQAQRPSPLPRLQTVTEQLRLPERFEGLAEVIDVAEEFF